MSLGGAHRGARPQERREAREAEPGFVPEEDQVRLDGEAFLHHPARVVDVAVEGAVGQVEHLDPISLPSAFRSSSACLIVFSGTAPYIEYSVIGNAST